MMSPFFVDLKVVLLNVSLEIKNYIKFLLYFSTVKQVPEQEIEDPISFFVNLILENIKSILERFEGQIVPKYTQDEL